MSTRIGLVQTNSTEVLKDNLQDAYQSIEQAAQEGLDLVAFPEMFLYIGENAKAKFEIAEPLDGPLVQGFQEKAQQHDISILLGSIYETIPDNPKQLYNTSILINRDGNIGAYYRKIHLCDIDTKALVNIESKTMKGGSDLVVASHEVGTIGLSICYDLRFPELFRGLRAKGAQIIFVPSAFFLHTGKHHWIPLLQARAIENQVYIAAPAQWGRHIGNRMSYGHSLIIDPWGSLIACAPEKACLISGTIDMDYLEEVRTGMPVFEHRRTDVY